MRRRHEATQQFSPPNIRRLRSLPYDRGVSLPSAATLTEIKTRRAPRLELGERTRFGRSLSLDRIESALREADNGQLATLTDLSRETVDTDPHLAAVLNKRFGALSALPWEVLPADGFGIDKQRARFYADVVRDQFMQLPNLPQRISQLAWGLFDGRSAHEHDWFLLPDGPGFPRPVHPEYGSVRWMLKDLEWIHPRRLNFGPRRELRINDRPFGPFSDGGIACEDFPLKFTTFLPQLFGEYQEREGLARRCLYWSFFKRVSARERLVLMELFGKPWRWLEVDEESTADGDDLLAADDMLQQLGSHASARFPRGTKFKTEQPGQGAGVVHREIIEESDKQLSKLVLGQTGTTDANPAGLNNSQANVMQNEQFMILLRDASLVANCIETCVTDAIIELNFGSEALPHAPHFVLRADVPLDRTKELGRLRAAIDAGLIVPMAEAYDISGFRQPKEDEAVIKLDTPPTHPLAVQASPERPIIVYPRDAVIPERKVEPVTPTQDELTARKAQEDAPETETVIDADVPNIVLAPTDVANVVKVNEARVSQGLGPLLLPNGSRDPDGDLTVSEFSAKIEAKVASYYAPKPEGSAVVQPPVVEPVEDTAVAELIASLTRLGSTRAHAVSLARSSVNVSLRAELERAHTSDAIVMLNTMMFDGSVLSGEDGIELPEEVRTAKQPDNGHNIGSIESVYDRGLVTGVRASTAMATAFIEATRGLEDSRLIAAALASVEEDMDLHPLIRSLERSVTMSLMTGVLSSRAEGLGATIPVATFAIPETSFVLKPFNEAVSFFKSLKVISKAAWTQLEASVKRRCFTIANVHSKRQLQIAKDELTKQMQNGTSLKDFSKNLSERFDSAGMTQLNPSHVENVYRTNMVNGYGSGRYAQMTSPEMKRTRGYWQIRGVNDGPLRQRSTHRAVANWIFAADDPLWETVYPPFGWNCRCRVSSISNVEVKEGKMKIRTGSEVSGLPDRGFISGAKSLIK